MKKQPEKTAQTKQALVDAFWETAIRRGIQNVTINEVAKRAGFNRGTFYVYFTDINDLLYQAEDEIIQDVRHQFSTIGQIERDSTKRILQTVSSKIIELFGQYDEKIFLLLGKNGDPYYVDRIREEMTALFTNILMPQTNIPHMEYIAALATSAFTGLLLYWHENGRKISVAELDQIAYRTMLFGISGIMSDLQYHYDDKQLR